MDIYTWRWTQDLRFVGWWGWWWWFVIIIFSFQGERRLNFYGGMGFFPILRRTFLYMDYHSHRVGRHPWMDGNARMFPSVKILRVPIVVSRIIRQADKNLKCVKHEDGHRNFSQHWATAKRGARQLLTLKWKGACKGTNIGEEGLAQIKVGFSESLGTGTDKYEKEDEELKTAYKRTRRLWNFRVNDRVTSLQAPWISSSSLKRHLPKEAHFVHVCKIYTTRAIHAILT